MRVQGSELESCFRDFGNRNLSHGKPEGRTIESLALGHNGATPHTRRRDMLRRIQKAKAEFQSHILYVQHSPPKNPSPCFTYIYDTASEDIDRLSVGAMGSLSSMKRLLFAPGRGQKSTLNQFISL